MRALRAKGGWHPLLAAVVLRTECQLAWLLATKRGPARRRRRAHSVQLWCF